MHLGPARLRFVIATIVAVIAGCQDRPAPLFDESAGRWIDLSHAYDEDTIYWPTDSLGFQLEELAYGETPGGFFYSAYRFSTAEHGGTHLDAPVHFSSDGRTADAIPVEQLIGPAVVVDVTDSASPDYLITIADIETHEAAHGEIPDDTIVLLRTGWGSQWNDRAAYIGTPLTGQAAIPELHFPGLDPAAARWLVDHRNVDAVGIDTPSIDYGRSAHFAAHVALAGDDVAIFENVANLDQLPTTGAFIVALPMKIGGGSGAPVRIAAFVPAH